MYIISITKKLFSEWNLIYNDPFLPAAELMGPSDQQRLEVPFSRATHDGLGIIELNSNIAPLQLSLASHWLRLKKWI